jgi:hypothetical protein
MVNTEATQTLGIRVIQNGDYSFDEELVRLLIYLDSFSLH